MKLFTMIVAAFVLGQAALAGATGTAGTFTQLDTGMQPQQSVQRDRPRQEPLLSVGGRGEVSIRPDMAYVVLGAVAQAEQASDAQRQVNAIMQRAFEEIRGLEIPEEAISTVGLTLEPVYSRQPPRGDQPHEPRIVGFRARNSIRIRVEDLGQIGQILDVGIAAGANELQGVNFQLTDDRRARQEALRRAVRDARGKAEAMAEAMDVRLDQIIEVAESEVGFRPQPMEMARRDMMMPAAEVGTPVHPGQIQLEARVLVRYRIAQREGQ